MNCKAEFLEHTAEHEVLCAVITHGKSYYDEEEIKTYHLPCGYIPIVLEDFLQSLDFTYDDGFGGQELFGTIWYKDGTWSDRGEYDGSEWWEYQSCPTIPKELI